MINAFTFSNLMKEFFFHICFLNAGSPLALFLNVAISLNNLRYSKIGCARHCLILIDLSMAQKAPLWLNLGRSFTLLTLSFKGYLLAVV